MSAANGEGHETVEKLSGIVPEAWFDLIGRVVPGTVIVLASCRTELLSSWSRRRLPPRVVFQRPATA